MATLYLRYTVYIQHLYLNIVEHGHLLQVDEPELAQHDVLYIIYLSQDMSNFVSISINYIRDSNILLIDKYIGKS